MKIFITRHGETTGDLEDRYGGNYDDHLTDAGKSQSMQLAEQLCDKGIEALFVSPLIRAQETATILSHSLRVPVLTEESLRERNRYGILTGMIKREAKEKYPEAAELVKVTTNTIHGAEPYADFVTRISDAFTRLAADTRYSTVAFVTHGGPLEVIVRDVIKSGVIKEKEHCAWVELHKEGDAFSLDHSEGITFA